MRLLLLLNVLLAGWAAGCTSDGEGEPDAPGGGEDHEHLYALATLTSAGDESLTYVPLLDALEPQTIDFDEAREFSGLADIWLHDGALFVTEGENKSITKFTIDDRTLNEGETVSFANYGLADIGFWIGTFVSKTRGYVVNGVDNYIVWNPRSMEIEGTMPMPPLEDRDGLQPFASYVDRSVAVVDGLMYHPFYFTDEDYFAYSETSAIAVYDVEDNTLVRVIDAPCPGLDHVSIDEDETLYFSSWVYAPGAAAVLDQPPTCVAKLEKGASEATVVFRFEDVTDGLEGGVFRYVGDGKALMSVLDRDHAIEEERDDPSAVAFGTNWRFWTYDMATGEAELVEAFDWNSGTPSYVTQGDGRSYALIGDYMTTTLYDITAPSEPEKVFDVPGWAQRLVQVR